MKNNNFFLISAILFLFASCFNLSAHAENVEEKEDCDGSRKYTQKQAPSTKKKSCFFQKKSGKKNNGVYKSTRLSVDENSAIRQFKFFSLINRSPVGGGAFGVVAVLYYDGSNYYKDLNK